MACWSNALEVEIRKHLLRAGSWTKPTALYVALCTVATTDADTGSTITEPVGNGYSRQQIDPSDTNWTGASSTNGTSTNGVALTWTASGGSWGTITHVAICSASSAGSMWIHGALAASKVVGDGDSFTIPVGGLSIQVDN